MIATAKGKAKSFVDHLNLGIIWQLLAHKHGIEWLAPSAWSCNGTLQFRVRRPKRGDLKPNLRTF